MSGKYRSNQIDTKREVRTEKCSENVASLGRLGAIGWQAPSHVPCEEGKNTSESRR